MRETRTLIVPNGPGSSPYLYGPAQRYLLAELKVGMFFISLYCSATLMATAKSVGVVLVIAALDAGPGIH